MKFLTVIVLAAFAAVSCSRERNLTPPNPVSTSKVNLLFFAGGNCDPCKKELPEVQEKLNHNADYIAGRIIPTVYVTYVTPSSPKVTQEFAEQFGIDLGLKFKMIADSRGKTYQAKYYQDVKQVPGTVIASESLEAIKTYPVGPVDLDVLMNDISGSLTKGK